MTVARPWVLWILFSLLPIALIQLRLFVKGRRDLRLLGTPARVRNVFTVKWFFTAAFLLLFFAFAVLAAAGIEWGESPVEEDRQGMEIVFVVDVSRSMLAEDPPPSRLTRAGNVLRGLVERLPAARFSLTVFKGQALTLVPLTEDRSALTSVSNQLGPNVLSAQGTNVAAGLAAALDSFPEGSRRHRLIVLFTDGESLSGAPMREAARAEEQGIPIIAVAAGSAEGAPIRLADGSFIRDDAGNVVVSSVDLDMLERIAGTTDGRLLRLEAADVFTELIRSIEAYEREQNQRGFRLTSVSRYRFFLGWALLFLVLHMGFRIVKWKGLL